MRVSGESIEAIGKEAVIAKLIAMGAQHLYQLKKKCLVFQNSHKAMYR